MKEVWMKVETPWITDTKTIEYREEEITLQPDRLLVRPLCVVPNLGTTLHIYRGEHQVLNRGWNPHFPFPLRLTGAAEVIEVGADVKGVNVGDRVHTRVTAAEVSLADPALSVPVPDNVTSDQACLAGPASVSLQGTRRSGITLGDTPLVMGQGPIGLFTSQFCRLAGARRVIATDLLDMRLEASSQLGVDVALSPQRDDVVARVMELTDGLGADVVLDVSGASEALNTGARAARRLARIVLIGWFVYPMELNFGNDFSPKGLELVVCHGSYYFGDWRQYQKVRHMDHTSSARLRREASSFILDLMSQGRLRTEGIITQRFSFSEMAEAWHFMDTKRDEYIGVAFER
jgi:threonine dehydrogenase-like Zn-dependent dehydrogenase